MLSERSISEHYLHGDLLGAIQNAVVKLGKSVESLTVDDLAPVDEFHIGGRIATENLLSQLNLSENAHILDIGCGLGGAARFVANKYKSHVTGIDLAQEYINTGRALCQWLKMDNLITLEQGSAISLPFKDNTFDGGYMIHVGMNIEDKALLFREICRVLSPGAPFGVYDIMRIQPGDLTYPVPWATDSDTNRLATSAEYRQALANAGFIVTGENDRRDFALNFFKDMIAKIKANGGPPPLGLHTLMKDSTPIKIKNMVDNIASGFISPIELITHRK